MSWHRLRRGVFGQPKAEEYTTKKTQLEQLQRLDGRGIIELYYLDETGFCLTPCVPYGWQPIGEYHTIDLIQSQLDEWRERKIEIFVLPSYSPQLNLIEILWRFMKYQWMEIDSYKDWRSLVDYVETMLREFGKQYVINFV